MKSVQIGPIILSFPLEQRGMYFLRSNIRSGQAALGRIEARYVRMEVCRSYVQFPLSIEVLSQDNTLLDQEPRNLRPGLCPMIKDNGQRPR